MKFENEKLIVYCGEDLVSVIEGTDGFDLDEVDFAVYVYKYLSRPVVFRKGDMKPLGEGRYEFTFSGEMNSCMRSKELGDYFIELFVYDGMTRGIALGYAFTLVDSSSKKEVL